MVAKNKKLKNTRGFTLVELAIVLVIIGLLVAGVIAGQELVKVAKVNAQISQIKDLTIGANAFKLKYNALPGDISPAKAAQFGMQSPSSEVANGNKIIDNSYDGGQTHSYHFQGEPQYFFINLLDTKLWKYNDLTPISTGIVVGTHLPEAKIGGAMLAQTFKKSQGNSKIGNGFVVGLNPIGTATDQYTNANIVTYSGGSVVGQGGFTPEIAFMFDQKYDDGKPWTGMVRSVYGYGAMLYFQGRGTPYENQQLNCADSAAITPSAVDPGTVQYRVVSKTKDCALAVGADF